MAKKRRKRDDRVLPAQEIPAGAAAPTAAATGDESAEQHQSHPDVQYERRDVKFPGVMIVVIVGLICGALDFYVVWTLFAGRQQTLSEENVSRFPLAVRSESALPNAPRLEQIDRLAAHDTATDTQQPASAEQLLSTLGRTAEDGFVHIPIERAMELVVDKLSVRTARTSPGKDRGLITAGESNSGRLFREAAP
ncbi:MAG TPA: hypothetical protein VGN12_12620 [Pirellulales bacterium]|jgi:hypothetical protein